jgi:hypothetical protein
MFAQLCATSKRNRKVCVCVCVRARARARACVCVLCAVCCVLCVPGTWFKRRWLKRSLSDAFSAWEGEVAESQRARAEEEEETQRNAHVKLCSFHAATQKVRAMYHAHHATGVPIT